MCYWNPESRQCPGLGGLGGLASHGVPDYSYFSTFFFLQMALEFLNSPIKRYNGTFHSFWEEFTFNPKKHCRGFIFGLKSSFYFFISGDKTWIDLHYTKKCSGIRFLHNNFTWNDSLLYVCWVYSSNPYHFLKVEISEGIFVKSWKISEQAYGKNHMKIVN